MTLDDHIGHRIRARRILLNKTTDELAVAIGLKTEDIGKFENGSVRIGAANMDRLSQILSVHIPYFFEGYASRSDQET